MSRPSLVLVPQHFGSLVFDRRDSRYLPFDQECTELLRRLAESPPQAVRQTVAQERRVQLEAFYEAFYQRGFFRFDGRLDAEVLNLSPPADHLCGPLAVHLEVVAACNLTCTHCFAGELPRREPPLTTAEMSGLFATLASMGCFRLGLTGGEPLLRRDLLEILDAAVEQGLHPCLTTNGLLLDESMARELGRRPLVWLNVSLDGAEAASNDAIRGRGVFARVLPKLELLRRHARFTLAFTITSRNADEVTRCADLARRVGAHAAVFRPLYPVGTARRHPELMPTFGQYTRALQSLEGDLHALDPFSPQARQQTRGRVYSGPGCGAANLVCSVSVGGQVNPCSFLGPDYDAGNLRQSSFPEIWHRSQTFHKLRGLPEEQFAGGCRARARHFHGSVHAADPWHDEYQAMQAMHPCQNLELQL
jgi:MoaA/NifB/PqqE/SkfB family radical SAM enzyme